MISQNKDVGALVHLICDTNIYATLQADKTHESPQNWWRNIWSQWVAITFSCTLKLFICWLYLINVICIIFSLTFTIWFLHFCVKVMQTNVNLQHFSLLLLTKFALKRVKSTHYSCYCCSKKFLFKTVK